MDEWEQVWTQKQVEEYERLIRKAQKVAMHYDFRPLPQFFTSVEVMLKDLEEMLEMTRYELRQEMRDNIEAFWSEEIGCIIIRYSIRGNTLYQEIPKLAFLWPYEYDAEMEKTQSMMIH